MARKSMKQQMDEARAASKLEAEQFRANAQARLAAVRQLADKAMVETEVDFSADSVTLRVFLDQDNPEVLNSLTSEKWDVESVEFSLRRLVEEREALERRRAAAQELVQNLSDENKALLREFRYLWDR